MSIENQLVLNNRLTKLTFGNGHLGMYRLPSKTYKTGDKAWLVVYRNCIDIVLLDYKDTVKFVPADKLSKYAVSFQEGIDLVELNIKWYETPLSKEDINMLCKKYLESNTSKVDRKDAKRVVSLIKKNRLKEAYDAHCDCDSFVRDGMPRRLQWHIS